MDKIGNWKTVMDLVTYTADDAWLTAALECDARVMHDLGGPVPSADISQIHQRRLAYIAQGAWYFKIVPDAATGPVGTIGLWQSQWNSAPIHEMCWMVLPQFQRRGFAGAAARRLIDRAVAENHCTAIHAFTGTDNTSSLKICEKLGFALLESCTIEYAGRPLICQHLVRNLHTDRAESVR